MFAFIRKLLLINFPSIKKNQSIGSALTSTKHREAEADGNVIISADIQS